MLAKILLILAFSALVSGDNPKEVQVVTKLGPIVGQVLRSPYQSAPVNRFLGIPFAQPPMGKLRFRRPVPIETKWSAPLQATAYPPQCIQNEQMALAPFNEPFVLNKNFSEDCLYLNIWSPKVDVANEEDLKPVLVWIHGGALLFGTSSFDLYDGEVLAPRADAVVVTINYRLSTHGFMYSSEEPEVSGNQGLWDQAAALEWIQEHIRYFGGNPNSVTIMGQSAGSWSVSAHILSPVSRSLFHNAILMSGAIYDLEVTSPEAFQKLFLTGIRKVDCATEEDQTISKKVLDCLQELPADKLQSIADLLDKKNSDLTPIVVIDGKFLPATPREMIASKNYKTHVNVLSSVVEDEGSFIMALSGIAQFSAKNPESLNLDQARGFLAFVEQKQAPSPLAQKLYFSGLSAGLNIDDQLRKRVGIAYGDRILSCPTVHFTNEIFKNSPETVQVYQWFYKAKLGNLKYLSNDWAGTCHCDDLYPVFGMPFRYADQYINRERDISSELISVVRSFIRTGKPGPEQSEWEPFFMANEGKDLVGPYYEIGNDFKKPENFKFNLKQLECELIWNFEH